MLRIFCCLTSCMYFREDDPLTGCLTEYTACPGDNRSPLTESRAREVTAAWTRQPHFQTCKLNAAKASFARALECKQSVPSCTRVILTANGWRKMEEQTDGTKAGINWEHLRCVLKQIHRMRLQLCTSTFLRYQCDGRTRK